MPRTGYQIGRVAGVPVRLDVTFLLVLPFLAWLLARAFPTVVRESGFGAERIAGPPWAWGIGLALGLFASVLVHELAHAWVLRRRGGRARSITLMMIGGVTDVAEPPKDLSHEAGMALAGPATSLVLGAVASALSAAAGWARLPSVGFALFFLGRINLTLGVFNLLPAFPMDGGRIVRAVLARRKGAVEATRIAAALGKAFAALFAAVGFVSANPILLLVAFFVYAGATAEQHDVLARALLGDLRVRDIMTPRPIAVAPDESVLDVGERMIRDRRVSLPVAEAGRVAGFVRLEAVERVAPEARAGTPARRVMEEARVVAPDDRVLDVMRLLEGPVDHLAVAEGERLVGVVSAFDVARGLRLRELERTLHGAPGDPSPHRR